MRTTTFYIQTLTLTALLFWSAQGLAADSLCVNKAAREFAVKIINTQLKNTQKAYAESDVFLKPVVIDGKKQQAYVLYATVGELYAEAFASQAFAQTEASEFALHWRFFRALPRGTTVSTALSTLFCKKTEIN
jgi:hypothetical protein